MFLRGSGIFCVIVGFFIFMFCFIRGIILGFDRGNVIFVVVFVCVIVFIDVVWVIGMFILVIVVCCMNGCGWKVYLLFIMLLGKLLLFNIELLIMEFVLGDVFSCWYCEENMLWVGFMGGVGYIWFMFLLILFDIVVRVVFVVVCGDEWNGNCVMFWNFGLE